jgi:hypothetical protein
MEERELSMKLVEIAERTVTMQLDPEDCELLARACRSLIEHDAVACQSMHLVEVMTAAFESAALAGGAYSHANLSERVTFTGRREGRMFKTAAPANA